MTTAYTIGTNGAVHAVALDHDLAVQYAREHYSYPVDITGVRLIQEASPAAVSLPRARDRVRPYDPHTSLEAALSVSRDTTRRLYVAIYNSLLLAACTDEELIARLHGGAVLSSESGVRSRRAELEDRGWVRKVPGNFGQTRTGRHAQRYEAVPTIASTQLF